MHLSFIKKSVLILIPLNLNVKLELLFELQYKGIQYETCT